MGDQHQVNTIIATAICECNGERPDQKIAPEQAKQMAKCIIAALSNAGLEIFCMKDHRMRRIRKCETPQT